MPPEGTSGVIFAAPSPAPARRLMVSGNRISVNSHKSTNCCTPIASQHCRCVPWHMRLQWEKQKLLPIHVMPFNVMPVV